MGPGVSFSEAALNARNLYVDGQVSTPREAWDCAVNAIFPEKKWYYRTKPCPRSSFLGLCEEGLIKGIPIGDYCNATKNKEYAIMAVNMLKENPKWRKDKKAFWKEIVKKNPISYDYQLDVVIALWNNNLIK